MARAEFPQHQPEANDLGTRQRRALGSQLELLEQHVGGGRQKDAELVGPKRDPQNPRIPPSGKPISQREIIAEPIAHDKVYELAREVAHGGFDPVESLIGLDEDEAHDSS